MWSFQTVSTRSIICLAALDVLGQPGHADGLLEQLRREVDQPPHEPLGARLDIFGADELEREARVMQRDVGLVGDAAPDDPAPLGQFVEHLADAHRRLRIGLPGEVLHEDRADQQAQIVGA